MILLNSQANWCLIYRGRTNSNAFFPQIPCSYLANPFISEWGISLNHMKADLERWHATSTLHDHWAPICGPLTPLCTIRQTIWSSNSFPGFHVTRPHCTMSDIHKHLFTWYRQADHEELGTSDEDIRCMAKVLLTPRPFVYLILTPPVSQWGSETKSRLTKH